MVLTQPPRLIPSPYIASQVYQVEGPVPITVCPSDLNTAPFLNTLYSEEEAIPVNNCALISLKLPGTRCPTCAQAGKELWVVPGRCCGYCGTSCVKQNTNKSYLETSHFSKIANSRYGTASYRLAL